MNDMKIRIQHLERDLRNIKTSTSQAKATSVNSAETQPPYSHPVTTLLYGDLPQIRLQYDSDQYTQYDELGRIDFGSDPQQKQASIYARRGATGGSGDYPSDIIFEIINDGASSMTTIMELLYSNRATINALTTINAQNGDADLLVLQDRDTTIHTFEIDGDITTVGDQNNGLQFIYNNKNTGTNAFAEFVLLVGGTLVDPTTQEMLTMGVADPGYTLSYMADSAWIRSSDRDLLIHAHGAGSDNKSIYLSTGTSTTNITHRLTVDTNGVTLQNGTNINEFSTDGTLAGDSDTAVPTEKAVKTYVDDLLDSNTHWMVASLFVSRSGGALTIASDGANIYENSTNDAYLEAQIDLPITQSIGGTTKYLRITGITVQWYQGVASASCYLDSTGIYRYTGGSGTPDTVLNDATNYGTSSSGYKEQTYGSFTNNTLSAAEDNFIVRISYTKLSASADWRLRGCIVTYLYV